KPGFRWREFLPILPFFEGFDADELDEMVAGARAFELGRGAPLFAQGDAATECYLVVRGALEIFYSSGRNERRVFVAGPGELVGHLALLDGAPHGAGA